MTTPAPQDSLPALERPTLAPVTPTDRVGSIDTLRGASVLGILAMNILAFALPMGAYFSPIAPGLVAYQGEYSGANKVAWWAQYVVFDMKMMTIFSMLFGAGLVLMHERAAGRGKVSPLDAPPPQPGRVSPVSTTGASACSW